MAILLLIDDDPKVRAFLRAALESAGHQVWEAAEGQAGLALLQAEPPDLVLCDLFMPGQEGLETIRVLRREFPALPVVAMSVAHELLPVAQAMGASAVLAKPMTAEELLRVVASLLPPDAQ